MSHTEIHKTEFLLSRSLQSDQQLITLARVGKLNIQPSSKQQPFSRQQSIPQFAFSARPLTQYLSKRILLHFDWRWETSHRYRLAIIFVYHFCFESLFKKIPPSPTNAIIKCKSLCLGKVAHEPHPGLAMTHSYRFKGRKKRNPLIHTRGSVSSTAMQKKHMSIIVFWELFQNFQVKKNPQNHTVINLTLFPCNVAKNKLSRYRVNKPGNLSFHLVLVQSIIMIKSKTVSSL